MQFANDAYPSPGASYAGTAPPPSLPPLAGIPPPFSAPTAFAPAPPDPSSAAGARAASPLRPACAAAVRGARRGVPPTRWTTPSSARQAPARTALRGFLVAFGTNPSGDFWPLTGGRLTVGRMGAAERTDIALQDPTISSRHAAVLVDAASGVVTVEDTGSTNGTFVNDEHIGFNGKRDLRDGDRVRFGAYTTIVKVLGRV